MRNWYFTAAFLIIVTFGIMAAAFPEGAAALLVVLSLSIIAVIIFRKFTAEKGFVTTIFLGALLARLAVGIIIHIFELREFVAGDAITYDQNGSRLVEYWTGQIASDDLAARRAWSTTGPGWGMNYLVGFLYLVLGKNIFAAQSFCAVFGAATAPMIYFCSVKMFNNKRAAKFAAVAVAFFPSFIIWSSQLLKDGLIIFLLVLAMTMVLQLQEKFHYAALLLLIFSIFGILSLRFYIFYMVTIAVAGSFIVGLSSSVESIARRTVVLVLMGFALTYFGVIKTASVDFERYGNLESVQLSRDHLASTAQSGYSEDIDVSTTAGAISALPQGFAYLMLAPFPWEVANFRQAITLPDVLLWWAMIPLMIYGLWYAIRKRLRSALPVLIFSLMLTLAYSIFQGNVGTAYRHRTQIQVFLFIFVAVGWALRKELKEDTKLIQSAKRERIEKRLRAKSVA